VIFLNANIKEIKKKVYDNRKMILVLIVLFLFAMSIRSNIVRFEGNYLFEPDAYYHARLVEELAQQGYINNIDPNVYYQLPNGAVSAPPSLYHYLSWFLYEIVALGAFNKELLAFTVQFFPVIFGALISIGMYFLGKEIFDSKKIGLIAGFLTAVTPAFAYRTMAGAQGDNSMGFLWMVIGLVFFVRALKTDTRTKKDLINAVLAGIFFSLMAIGWSLHLLIPVVLIPSIAIILLYKTYDSKKKPLKDSAVLNIIIKSAIALGIYTIISFIYGSDWITAATNVLVEVLNVDGFFALLIGVIGVIAFIALAFYLQSLDKSGRKMGLYLAIALLYIGLLLVAFMFVIVPDFFYNSGRTSIISMVGEESLGITSFGIKYNVLLILPIIGLVLFPFGLFLLKRKDIHLQVLLWFGTLVTLFMAYYKLKFTFVFGLGLVMGALLAVDFFFKLLEKYNAEKGIEAKIIIGALFFIIVLGVAAAPIYLNQFQPFANSDTRWIDAMDWINNNTTKEAKFFNWWGEGHQLAFVTERNFSSDNRNYSAEANSNYAEFMITSDVNKAYDIAKNKIGADYVIIHPNNFSSGQSFAFYAAGKIDSSVSNNFSDFQSRFIGCSPSDNGLVCNGQTIPTEQFEQMAKDKWTSAPTDFYNGQLPLFYYRNDNILIVIGPSYNETNLAKVYFNSDETSKYYEPVFDSGGLKIFKIK